jgi:putative ABC transport system substrate-binding protein
VDIIVTGTNPNTVAAMTATTTIPIVMTNSVNPVGTGLVASLARPGGNVTGFAADAGDEIFGKRLELLNDAVPNLSRIGLLWNPDATANLARLKSTRDSASLLGLTLVSVEARGPDALEQAFATMVRESALAFVVMSDGVLFNYRIQIAGMALQNRLPGASTPERVCRCWSPSELRG